MMVLMAMTMRLILLVLVLVLVLATPPVPPARYRRHCGKVAVRPRQTSRRGRSRRNRLGHLGRR